MTGIPTVVIRGRNEVGAAFVDADREIQSFADRAMKNLAPLDVEIASLTQRQKAMDAAVAVGRSTRAEYIDQLRTLTADARSLAMRTAEGSLEQQKLGTIAATSQQRLVGLGRAERTAVDGFEALSATVHTATSVMQGNLMAAGSLTTTLQRFAVKSPTMVNMIGGLGAVVTIVGALAMAFKSAGKEAEEAASKMDRMSTGRIEGMIAANVANQTMLQRMLDVGHLMPQAMLDEMAEGAGISLVMRGLMGRQALMEATIASLNAQESIMRGGLQAARARLPKPARPRRERETPGDLFEEFRTFSDRPLSTRDAVQRAQFERGDFMGGGQVDRDLLANFGAMDRAERMDPFRDLMGGMDLDEALGITTSAEAMAELARQTAMFGEGLSTLEQIGVAPMQLMQSAVNGIAAGFEAAIGSLLAGGHVLDNFLKAGLGALAAEARAKAVFELAEGFASLFSLTKGGPPAAAMHFKAAAFYGSAALLAGAGAAAVGSGGGGGATGGPGGARVGSGAAASVGVAQRNVTVEIPAGLIDLPRGRAARDWLVGVLESVGADNVTVRTR